MMPAFSEILTRLGLRDSTPPVEIGAFVAVAFGWTWSVWAIGISLGHADARWLQAVGAWGPLIGAAVVTRTFGGDLRAWARQVVPKRAVKWRWYVVAVGIPLAFTQAGAILGWVLGEPVGIVDPGEVLFRFGSTLFIAGALEEFGWRGFLQPRLQERWSALRAAVLVGVFWWLWHVPMLVGGTGAGYGGGELIGLLIGLPLFSIMMAWIYNSTRGGLVFVMLFHATVNATPILEATDYTPLMEIAELAVLLLIPVGIILYHGREDLASVRPDPAVPGRSG